MRSDGEEGIQPVLPTQTLLHDHVIKNLNASRWIAAILFNHTVKMLLCSILRVVTVRRCFIAHGMVPVISLQFYH